jgi:hypothetical protein
VLAWLYAITGQAIDLFAFSSALTMLWLPVRLIDNPFAKRLYVVVVIASVATVMIGLGLALEASSQRPHELVVISLGMGVGLMVLVDLLAHILRRGSASSH